MQSDGTIIQIAVSLSSAEQLKMDEITDADAVEIRLDLMPDLGVEAVADLAESFPGQIILTLRSREEGGAFTGDVDAWMERIRPFLPYVTAVDVEIRYQAHARALKEAGKNIIASCHRNEMLTGKELETLHSELRSFGDIPKIAVYPHDSGELLSLLQYTHMAPKPLIVSVTGTICRYARPLLPLFGSLYTYCYIDKPTSPGQYSLREMRTLGQLLAPGMIDTWFDGKTPGQMES
jgi:3-dehydroquinate dehydratase I